MQRHTHTEKGRDSERERNSHPFSLLSCPKCLRDSKIRVKNSIQLPHGRFSYLSHHHCFPEVKSAESRNQELELGTGPRHADVRCVHPNQREGIRPETYRIILT